MLKALTAAQIRTAEAAAVARDVSLDELMARAGKALADETIDAGPEGRAVVLTGSGNNGGDGWVCARLLHTSGIPVHVMAMRGPEELSGEAAKAARDAEAAGVSWERRTQPPAVSELQAAVVVDALLGVGARLPLSDELRAWCEAANDSRAMIFSADVPTGVDADTGRVDDGAILADVTVTFGSVKVGLVTFPGAAQTGELIVADIGLAADAQGADAPQIWSDADFAAMLPRPRRDTHKNDRGRVLIVAGSGRFPGAAILAARGAARAGAGYVTLAVPEQVVEIAQAHLVSSPVVGLPSSRGKTFSSAAARAALELAEDYDSVVIGPGITLADGAIATARELCARLNKPLVVDADALNALVDAVDLLGGRTAPTVLTPHPGELARLLGTSVTQVQDDRLEAGRRLAHGTCRVVLKGAGTVVTEEGRQVIITAGTPALATAGTGDVLAGMTGALLGTGAGAFEAAALAAHLHGRAGEVAARALTEMCVTAEDIPEYLPLAVAGLMGESGFAV